jgi:nucleoside-diphosphate-sugar epimerase
MANGVANGQGKVLLTGVSGFIGLHCAKQLIETGFKVRGTVRSLEKQTQVEDVMATRNIDTKSLEFTLLDLTTDAGWEAAMEGCQYVMHVASPFWIANPKNEGHAACASRRAKSKSQKGHSDKFDCFDDVQYSSWCLYSR